MYQNTTPPASLVPFLTHSEWETGSLIIKCKQSLEVRQTKDEEKRGFTDTNNRFHQREFNFPQQRTLNRVAFNEIGPH